MGVRTDDISIRLKLLGARDIVRGTTAASRSITGMQKKIERVGVSSVLMAQGLESGRRGARALGTALKYTGLAAGALAIVEIPRMLNAAVDLGEQQNKTRVVFEESSKGILRWSKNTASALGISSREALEASGVFGNMLVPMGIAEDRAAKMSKRLVTLAADMASFNNKNPAEVLDALRAGLAGETEPLRGLGVFLSAERVGLEATKKGLADNYTELTANQKAQLAYGLILKDTVKAQGDFGRTSDSLANRQRILKAQLEGVEAQLGEGLIPVFEDLADVAAETMDRVSAILNNDDLTGEQKFDRIMGVVDGLVQDGIEKLEQYMPLIAEAGAGLGGRLAVSLGKAFLASNIWGKLFIGLWLTKILLGGQGVKVMAAVAFHLAKAFGWKFLATVAPYFAAEMGVEGIGSALGSRMGGLKDMFGRAGGTLGKVMGTTWGKAFIATALVFGLAPLAEKIQDKLGLDDENSNLLETLTGEDVGGPVRDALGMEPDSEFGDFKGLNPGKGKRRRDGDRGPKGFRLPLTRTPALRPLGPQPAQRGGNKRVVLQIPIDGKVIAEKVLSQAELAAALQ